MKFALPVLAVLAAALPASAVHPERPTLRDEAAKCKFVIVCRAENPREEPGGGASTDLVVTRVIKADPAVKVGDRIRFKHLIAVPDPKMPPHFLMFGEVEKGIPHVYRGAPATPALLDYFEGSMEIDAKDHVKLMRYAFAFLEHKDDAVDSDAGKTFWHSEDRDLREAGRHLNAQKLREWLKAEETGSGRRSLYARLLGCCGGKDDAAFLRKVIDDWVKDDAAFLSMAGLLIAYTELDPKAGWAFTRELAKDAAGWAFRRELANEPLSLEFIRYVTLNTPRSASFICRATLKTARYYLTERPGVVNADDARGVIDLVLNQGYVAELAIEDLRVWREWSFTDKVLGLWGKKGFDEKIVRRAVVKYALQCPDAKAKAFIAELKKTEPHLVEYCVWRLRKFEGTDGDDVLLADFEGAAYPDGWKTTGTAFGKGPAKGTLPNQMAVTGFLGKGLVNSYLDGDKSTGTLTSAAFKIERKYLNFLVGGGKHAKTCVNLLVGGKVVRTATGPNDKPGGSERLDWHSWDVAEFEGKEAVIQIVDEETGGWGHINADHFVQSDKKKQAEPMARPFEVDKRYLHLPVKTGAAMRRVTLSVRHDVRPKREQVRDEIVREFDIELADGEKPDYWAFADVSALKGKTVIVKTTLPADSKALAALKLADDVPDAEKLYREKHRPLFHFTSRFGWLNDPNGLVFVPTGKGPFGNVEGEWHLFYQHNPYGVNWGNMHWGHAVSKDLVRWKEEGIALYPRKYGDWAYSGSAVVDNGNTSGWGTKEKAPLVLAYTSTGRGECVAYSTDNGRTWTEYDKNPVVKHAGRDPKLVWYEKGKHWVMAVYDEFEKKQWIAFYTSPDLKAWTFASRIEGFYECPDLFPLVPMAKGPNEEKWILYGADGKYLVGDFDGKEYKPDFKEKKQLWYGNFYAAQTFDNTPRKGSPADSRVQIGWARGVTFPGMPFNQQMTVPVHLRLSVAGGSHLVAMPDSRLGWLHERDPAFEMNDVAPLRVSKEITLGEGLDAFDLQLDLTLGKPVVFSLDLRGTKLIYDGKKGTITCKGVTAPVKAYEGKLDIRVLVDRGSVEVFAGFGQTALSVAAIPDEKNRKLVLTPTEGEFTIRIAGLYRIKSAWEK